MVRFDFDLRFAIIAMEGHAARAHAEYAIRRLERLPHEINEFVLRRLDESGYAADEAERSGAYHEISWLEEELPRLESYGVLFVLFASFEAVLKRLPRYVVDTAADPISTYRGTSFVRKAVNYFREELGVELFETQSDLDHTLALSDLRNAVAHATGVMHLLKPVLRSKIEHAAATYPGIDIRDGVLILAPSFLTDAALRIQQILSGVIESLKAAFPPHGRNTPPDPEV